MVASPRLPRLTLPRLRGPLAPLIAGAAGLVTALLFALMPGDLLDLLAVRSGIADVLRVAQPPLGGTARAALALLGGGGVALAAWLALLPLLGARKVTLFDRAAPEAEAAPKLRRADAHPDAPARRPVLANRDLGTPFLEVTAKRKVVEAEFTPVAPLERDIPADLDLPLAAFDPAAIPARPATRPFAVAPLATPPREPKLAPGERIETFELTPMVRPSAPFPDVPARSTNVESLLDRLERGVAGRAPTRPQAASVEQTLSALRRLAAQAG